MLEQYFIFHGYGGENSLIPLAEYMQQQGKQILIIDDQRFPYERHELYNRLSLIKETNQIILITSAHIWFDEYNFRQIYRPNPNIISVLELIDFLKPVYTVFYPHDVECFMHSSELKWIDIFDLVMLPYHHNMYYQLKHICKRVEIVGWIKKPAMDKICIKSESPTYYPALFPSNIVSFYDQLGVEGYAQWFRNYIGPQIPIKMPAGDDGVYPLLSKENYYFLPPSFSVYDAMAEYNLIIGSGHSSIIFESAFSGIPVISLLDGMFTDKEYLKTLSGIKGVYPIHPEELQDFLLDLKTSNKVLETGPDILPPFDFKRVYQYLTKID